MSLLLLKFKALLSGAGIRIQRGNFDILRCKIDWTCSEVGQRALTNPSPF